MPEENNKPKETTSDWRGESNVSLPDGYGDEFGSTSLPEDYYGLNAAQAQKEARKISNRIEGISVFPDDYLVLNDIILTGVPTTAIAIDSKSHAFVAETLRSRAPIVTSEGWQSSVITISLIFPPGEAQTIKLRRLVAELSRHPLVYTYNNKIKKALQIKVEDTLILILESGTIRSADEAIGSIVLDLTLHYFNYKPFTDHFWYNAFMPGISGTSVTEKIDWDNVQITDLAGSAAQDFSLNYQSEKLNADIRKGLKTIDLTDRTANVPTTFPATSDAWMYYADYLTKLSKPLVSSPIASDCVGFKVRKFKHYDPPLQAQVGKGSIINTFGRDPLFPAVKPLYNPRTVDAPIATTSTEKKANTAIKTVAEKAEAGFIVFYRKRTGRQDILKLYDDNGKIDKISQRRLSELSAPLRNPEKKDPPPLTDKLIYLLNKVHNLFPSHPIIIWSGSRFPKKPGGGGAHAKGGAMDLSIEGVPNNVLFKTLKTHLFKENIGLGFYPNSKFCHIDDRVHQGNKTSVFWVDMSGPGEKSVYLNREERLEYYTKYIASLDISQDQIQAAAEDIAEDTEDHTDVEVSKEEERSAGWVGALDKVPMARDLEQERINQQAKEDKARLSEAELAAKKSIEVREKWIQSMREQGWEYYRTDNKIRNIFYSETSLNISSKQYVNHTIAKNIVCSGISVTFGHRIVSHQLLGQDRPTWQFLGAGNKTGTLVFTFSGEQGKASADILKYMIYNARKNARYFGSIIPEAGSIKILNEVLETNEYNNILSALNIEDVIISDIEEISSPDGKDKHQLVISFIAQDFAEEKFDNKFTTLFENKKKIISGIMKYVLIEKDVTNSDLRNLINKDYRRVYMSSEIGSTRQEDIVEAERDLYERHGYRVGGGGRPYKLKSNVPRWFGELVADAIQITQEAQDKAPPIDWKIYPGASKTWRDLYKDWSADKAFYGRVKNIARSEQNTSTVKQMLTMYKGQFDHNGGAETNKTHKEVYIQWLDRMNTLVNRAKKYMTDEENFAHYFGEVGNELRQAVFSHLGECYEDMLLPDIPLGKTPLPPEFYVYNTNAAADSAPLERLLEHHINNEIKSLKHFNEDTLLGGSYVSENLPKIIKNRRDYIGKFDAETKYASLTPAAAYSDASRAWDPIFTHPQDDVYKSDTNVTGPKAWQDRVKSKFGGSDEKATTSAYMSQLIKLNPYLRSNKWWVDDSGNETEDQVIRSLYGDDWDKIVFGPNIKYVEADRIAKGIVSPKDTQAEADKIKEDWARLQASQKLQPVDVPGTNRTITASGMTTVGDIPQETSSGILDLIWSVEKAVISTAIEVAQTVVGLRAVSGQRIDEVVRRYSQVTSKNELLKKLDTEEYKDLISQYKSKNNKGPGSPEFSAKTAAGIALGSKANLRSIRRAYPTFKIYFIEEDDRESESVDGEILRAFDDFYSYSAIQEIKITRSRKIPSDLATIRMTNVGGKLLRRRFGEKDSYQQKNGVDAEYAQGIFADTELENPFEKMILQDGVKVQIRLGYANDPNQLETVFLGQIVEVGTSDGGSIIEIMCQGYGAELESVELGPLEDGPEFYSSQQALSAAIIQPSIVNFGRRNRYNAYNIAEIREAITGGSGVGLLASLTPSQLLSTWADNKLYQQFLKYPFLNNPQDDNIFAPPPDIYASTWDKFWNNACLYRPLKQTPWQIFKEHELRHPGWIASAVPYGHTPRMTMFFGMKGQHYWSRPVSQQEIYVTNLARDEAARIGGLNTKNFLSAITKTKVANLPPGLAEAIIEDSISSSAINSGYYLGKLSGRFRPFRNYHYLDANYNILKNTIRTSIDGTFNEVEVLFTIEEEEIQDNDADDTLEQIQLVANKEAGVLSVKLDDNIPDEYIRSYRAEYPSCVTEDMAKRYGQALFARHLKDTYKGELVILGEPTIKPYDICYLRDPVTSMNGPIEVESVTHIFNRDMGYCSIITPDLCVDTNEFYSASIFDITAAAVDHVYRRKDMPWVIQAAATSPITTLASLAAVKFMLWNQDGAPVHVSPLELAGKPFMSVTIGNRASMFTTVFGKWDQYWDDVRNAWNRVDISEEFHYRMTEKGNDFLSWLGSTPELTEG